MTQIKRGPEWAAGVLEGEASFQLKRQRCPVVQVQMTDLDVLEALQEVFQAGNIVGPVAKQRPHHKDSWVWSVTKAEEAATVMKAVLPFLFSRRGARVSEILEAYEASVLSEQRERTARNEGIVALYSAGGRTVQSIADELGLHRTTVSGILNS